MPVKNFPDLQYFSASTIDNWLSGLSECKLANAITLICGEEKGKCNFYYLFYKTGERLQIQWAV